MLSDGTVKMAEASKRTSSAAQSLLAEYASTAFDRELLNTQRNWLAANQTTGDLGDDLRFLKALSAQKGYEVDAMELEQQLIARYFPGNKLSGKVSLSDLDPSALAATQSWQSRRFLSLKKALSAVIFRCTTMSTTPTKTAIPVKRSI